MDVSVIVCAYNPEIDELKTTLDSLVIQKDVEFEIVISDDGSEDNRFNYLKEYFNEQGFKNYKLKMNEVNNGTVASIIEGLSCSVGKYIYTMGQGDAFTDEYVLRDVYRFMSSKEAECIFTKLVPFEWEGLEKKERRLSIPLFIGPWKKQNYKKIKENVIVFNDQISGATIFFERSFCCRMIFQKK